MTGALGGGTNLDAGDERGVAVVVELGEDVVGALREQREDCLAGVAADDGHDDALGGGADDLRDKRVGAAAVERGDAEELVGVVAAGRSEDLARDRHRRVDRVSDDACPGLRADLHRAAREAGVPVPARINTSRRGVRGASLQAPVGSGRGQATGARTAHACQMWTTALAMGQGHSDREAGESGVVTG